MPIELEIESKSMLQKADYERLNFAYKNIKNYKQINYYISSPELLEKISDYGMRIRVKNGKYELTLKVTEEVGKKEINQEITRKSLAKLHYFHLFPLGEVKDFLVNNKVCDPSKLSIIGKLTTIRKDIKINDSLISIDKSKYNGKIDYEIECENSDEKEAENTLKNFLENNQISYQKNEQSKLARFLNTIR